MNCCSNNSAFPSKPAADAVTLSFDFSGDLEPDDPIDEITSVIVTMLAGVDPNPGAILSGTPSISIDGFSVLVPTENGLPGNTYLVSVLVKSAERPAVSLSGYLPVH